MHFFVEKSAKNPNCPLPELPPKLNDMAIPCHETWYTHPLLPAVKFQALRCIQVSSLRLICLHQKKKGSWIWSPHVLYDLTFCCAVFSIWKGISTLKLIPLIPSVGHAPTRWLASVFILYFFSLADFLTFSTFCTIPTQPILIFLRRNSILATSPK